MISLLLKLLALRPLLSMAIFGVPILTLLAIGFFAVVVLKVILVIAAIVAVIWVVRRISRGPAS